jgi:hypothetical protein
MADLTDNPDNLELFFDIANSNRRANAARFPDDYNIVRRVNTCLSTAGKHLAQSSMMHA